MKQPRMQVPVWSVKSVAVLSIITVGVVAGCVFLTNKPVIWELTTTLGVLAGVMFSFLAIGLYNGVRLQYEPLKRVSAPEVPQPVPKSELKSEPPPARSFDWFSMFDAGTDLLELLFDPRGCLVALIVGVLFFALLGVVMLVWESGVLLVFAAGVYWLFSRALRQVFLKSRICRDNVLQTLRYSFMYTTLYTGWMFALLFIGQKLVR